MLSRESKLMLFGPEFNNSSLTDAAVPKVSCFSLLLEQQSIGEAILELVAKKTLHVVSSQLTKQLARLTRRDSLHEDLYPPPRRSLTRLLPLGKVTGEKVSQEA